MGLLGSLFSAAADIAKETITETMNQNETEKFIKIMMERDAQNAEANEKLYQDWLTHERSNYFAAKKNTIIHDAFDVLMDSFEDTGKFDFSAVDSLSDELKSSDSYKQEAADVVNLCCEALVKLHQKCCISIRFVMQTIHNLQRFADIVPSIRGLDRHYDAFFPVDNADCSFLTDFDSIAEGLEAAKNDSDNYLAMVGSNSPLSRLAALKDILKSEDYVAAVSNLLFSFVVTGEQLTMTQVSFAIYALYLPTKDFQCTQAVDTIEQNQKYQNRLITLKQAQNPKIKNYIESINEILISGLEAWLNNNNTSSMYD